MISRQHGTALITLSSTINKCYLYALQILKMEGNFNSTVTGTQRSITAAPNNMHSTSTLNITNFTVCYNCTGRPRNISSQIAAQEGYDYFNIILLLMLALIFVVGTVGNSVVCYVFGFKQRKRRSVPETLFLYLGAIDLTSSIINPGLYVYWTVTKYSRWDFGIVGCKLLAPLAPVSVTLSALIILIIAIDRYTIICGQFGRSYSRNRIHCAVLFAAIFSICIFLPYIILLEVSSTCSVLKTGEPEYAYSMISALLFQDVSFIAVLAFTNSRTFSRLRRQSSVTMERTVESRRLRSHKRVARILLAMSLVFCLLVLPRDLVQLTYIISWLDPPGVSYTQALLRINAFLKVLQTSNSCVNVFIYSKMHTKFRGHLFRLCYKAFGRRAPFAEKFGLNVVTEEMTPRTQRRILKFNEGIGTPSDTPVLQRKHVKREKIQDREGANPLLVNHIKSNKAQFQSDVQTCSL